MKTEEYVMRKMVADEGNVFCNVEKTIVFGTTMFLGVNDAPENYMEITLEEAEEIKKEPEERQS